MEFIIYGLCMLVIKTLKSSFELLLHSINIVYSYYDMVSLIRVNYVYRVEKKFKGRLQSFDDQHTQTINFAS